MSTIPKAVGRLILLALVFTVAYALGGMAYIEFNLAEWLGHQ